MAAPKVFVSSTCFDLGEVRDALRTFIRSFGFDPILSEHGDVFFHPDLHTHEACVNEVGNCQMMVLVIGGRFGGRYISDKSKSITNAEYEAAIANKIPIFTYIKSGVLANHHICQENKDSDFVNSIKYPAIDRQEDAPYIFDFINHVRRASVNNGYEGFDVARDIEEHLRKQWAGMFFDYLKNRSIREQITNTNALLASLKSSSEKLEEISKKIYSNVDKENYATGINQIEIEARAKEFLDFTVGRLCTGGISSTEDALSKVFSTSPEHLKWYEYLVAAGIYEKIEIDDGIYTMRLPEDVLNEPHGEGLVGMEVKMNKPSRRHEACAFNYEMGFKLLDRASRENLLQQYVV
jgi:Domain of unknown function (DUF4062)